MNFIPIQEYLLNPTLKIYPWMLTPPDVGVYDTFPAISNFIGIYDSN